MCWMKRAWIHLRLNRDCDKMTGPSVLLWHLNSATKSIYGDPELDKSYIRSQTCGLNRLDQTRDKKELFCNLSRSDLLPCWVWQRTEPMLTCRYLSAYTELLWGYVDMWMRNKDLIQCRPVYLNWRLYGPDTSRCNLWDISSSTPAATRIIFFATLTGTERTKFTKLALKFGIFHLSQTSF